MSTTEVAIAPTGLERQRAYIEEQVASGTDDSIIQGVTFVNSMRDLGYVSTATALNEIYDNAIQAQATTIHTVFGFEGPSTTKPTAIAVIDDGHGMYPNMLPFAVKWGGTDRENDRRGIGRYGFGLPSSCVSLGRRFHVFSRTSASSPLLGVTVDLDEIGAGKHTAPGGRVSAPKPEPAALPSWLSDYVHDKFSGLPHGTIVLVEVLDRVQWKTATSLKRHLLESTGVVYRNFLRTTKMVIAGESVMPVDPLFLTPGARFYDVDADRAEGLDDVVIDVKNDTGDILGQMKIRASYLPPTFGYKDKTLKTSSPNERMHIMGDHEGLIVLRNGRQMAVLSRAEWPKGVTFRNEDRYWQIELDFPAVLDELFSVTTSKQGVRPNDRIWQLLKTADIDDLTRRLRERAKSESKQIQNRKPSDDGERPPESAVLDAEKFFSSSTPTVPLTPAAEERAQTNLDAEVHRRAEKSGVPVPQVRTQVELEIKSRPFALVEKDDGAGNLFYRPERIGTQRRVYLNTAHEFYKQIYGSATATPELQQALSVLILTLASAEFDSRDDRQEFYENERAWWSRFLKTSLRKLASNVPPAFAEVELVEESAQSNEE